MSWDRFKEINKVANVYHECALNQLGSYKGVAKSFIDSPHSLLLQGACGTGKTFFMFTLIKELLEAKKWGLWSLRFHKAKHLSDRMEEEFKKYGTTSHVIEQCLDVNVLFIDDFGVQSRAERMERDFYEICDVRLGDMRPTVFSTNLTDEEIRETFGARIHSRLRVCERVLFNGEDRRSFF